MRGKVGLLISHSDNYYGIENKLHDKALKDLVEFSTKLDYDVVKYGPIKSGEEAEGAKKYFDSQETDYLIMFIADFSLGDIMLPFENSIYPIGIWFSKEPQTEGDIQLNSAVSANMFSSIAQRKFNTKILCDWYYGDICDKLVKDKLTTNLKVIKAKKNIENATIGLLGDVAPTFYNLENNRIKEYFPKMNIVKFDIDYLVKEVENVAEVELQEAKNLIINSCNLVLAEEKSIVNSAKVYVVLKKYILEIGRAHV